VWVIGIGGERLWRVCGVGWEGCIFDAMDLFLETSYPIETGSTADGVYKQKPLAVSVLN